MVAIDGVRQVVARERQDVRRVLPRPDVRRPQVDDREAVRLGLVAEHVGLPSCEHQLRAERESAVGEVQAKGSAQRRDARQRLVDRRQGRIDVANAQRRPGVPAEPDAARGVEADEPAVALDEIQNRQVVRHLPGPVAEMKLSME